ncbi:MAG: CPBP family intramembrane metalloprotease [Sphingomonadaceae bacterium]|nr:CPBP family intramembrane metalloprotease [Sphingomonadaceae bacterium]
MTGQFSSLQEAGFLPREWNRFFAFLRQPVLPPMASPPGWASLRGIAQLYALDILLMAGLVGAGFLVKSLGVELPRSELEDFTLDAKMIGLLVLFAPLMEEIGFRSWLSGRTGHFVALVAVGIGLVALPVTQSAIGMPLVGGGFLLLALAMAGLALWLWRGQPAGAWFTRHFRWFYYASALAFALIHFTNYKPDEGLVLLALVVPQFIAGLIFGYGRVQYGLWASVLLHMLHNALVVGAVLGFGGSGAG